MSDIHDEPKKTPAGGHVTPEGPAAQPSAAQPSAAQPPVAQPLSAETTSLLGLIDRLGSLLERSDLVELEVESGGTGIVLRKPSALAPGAAPAPASADAPAGGAGASAVDPVEPAPAATTKTVKAPLTGIFYAASSPGSPPYVSVGQHVVAGQVIGLIEAMKLFNEIKSDLSGRVVRVVAETGKLVKAKQPLIEVEP
ncbi:MAG: biotin/lipoyl-containing protein [Candidatus Limnocylindrales bacterium]